MASPSRSTRCAGWRRRWSRMGAFATPTSGSCSPTSKTSTTRRRPSSARRCRRRAPSWPRRRPAGRPARPGCAPATSSPRSTARRVGAGDVVDYVSNQPIGPASPALRARRSPTRRRRSRSASPRRGPAAKSRPAGAGKIGLALQTLTPDVAASLGIDRATKGAVITDIVTGSPAEQAGLRPGDVIVEIDRRPVGSADEAVAGLHGSLEERWASPARARAERDPVRHHQVTAAVGRGLGPYRSATRAPTWARRIATASGARLMLCLTARIRRCKHRGFAPWRWWFWRLVRPAPPAVG